MEKVLREKVKVGISACMYGCEVRYNKKGWSMLEHLGRGQSEFIWHPMCPECMAGLGVPREPIRISGGNGIDVWEGKARIKGRSGEDVTERVKHGAQVCMEMLKSAGVYVYIFMEGSPSCGVYRTTLKNKRIGKPPGVFGALLLKEGFFLIPAADLQSPVRWWDWKRRLNAFAWLRSEELRSKADIYDMWHTLKFICQELDNEEAREIGKMLAKNDWEFSPDYAEDLRNSLLLLLRRPSSLPKIKHMLWKNYMFYKKKSGMAVDEIMKPEELRNMTHIANELMIMERKAAETGLMFGSAPIHYKGR